MHRNSGNFRKYFAIFLAFAVVFALFQKIKVNAKEAQELKDSLSQKTQELDNVNSQIKAVQKQLEATQNAKSSLQNELNQINYSVKQMDLGIKSSEILVNKYSLESEQIQNNISEAEVKIEDKKQIIAEALRKLQQEPGVNSPLEIFLKNKDLSESVFQMQGLVDLQQGLYNDVTDLNVLRGELSNDLEALTNKKIAKEAESDNLKNKKIIAEETKKSKQDFLAQTKNKEKNYQVYLSDLQKKQTTIASEIEKIDEELRLKINPGLLPTRAPGILAMPITGLISQDYGATSFATRGGYRGKWHNGIDIAAPIGTPVFAAEKGKIVATGNQDKYCYRGAYGKFVVVEHENNLTTLYAHFSLIVATQGAEVKRGDLIGYVGRTGYATGPHLHFTVFASQTFRMGPSQMCGPMPFGGDINPINYL
ncbi:MAG: peptidoglycan DD-metalloendopeptidase family protein [Patescibacteria group bacterium]|nr:peptidoglycan DD-metalloendopeptidase family protein [Patescibacteria group bacterium]